ncbi:MAG: PAS domain S-box protein [Candidatus Eisenbacteria bacterium]|nr:PAS domain S-box protein [Candidatus Eisenbacteria bacterium]
MKKQVTHEKVPLAAAGGAALVSLLTMGGSMLVVIPLTLSLVLAVTSLCLARKKRELSERTDDLEDLKVNTECMIESLSSGLITIDADGRILSFNRAGRKILGIGEREVCGMFLREVFTESQTGFVERLFETYIRGEGKQRFEMSFAKTDGESMPLGVNTSVLRDGAGSKMGVIAVFQDLTQVKKTEEISRRKDRLAAIGELSAVIAHEIRNSLGPISGSVDLLMQESNQPETERRLLSIVSVESRRLQRFVSELLEYAEDRPIHSEEVDVESLLGEVVAISMRHPSYCDGISVRLSCEPAGLTAAIDADLLRRTLLNLGINAFEAIGMVGTLTIEACVEKKEPGVDGGSREKDEELVIRFSDDGPGMSEGELKQALEPFFSTKRGGTGLGLSIVQKTVEQHGGTLAIRSTRGLGTTVTLRIPRTDEESRGDAVSVGTKKGVPD